MADALNRVTYVHEISGSIHLKLCNILDSGPQLWKEIAAAVGYKPEEIDIISQRALGKGTSPTAYFLMQWSSLNPTIHYLFYVLNTLKLYRLMDLLCSVVPKDLIDMYYGPDGNVSGSTRNMELPPTAPPPTPLIPLAMHDPYQPRRQREIPLQAPVYPNRTNSAASPSLSAPPGTMISMVFPSVSVTRSVTRSIREEKAPEYSSDTVSDFNSLYECLNHYTYVEILQGTGKWAHCLGKGSFGEVYRAYLNGTNFAVKRFIEPEENEEQAMRITRARANELIFLSKIRHPNVISLFGMCVDIDVCLIYELMENGSLYQRLHQQVVPGSVSRTGADLEWRHRLSILTDAACGLQYLHTVGSQPMVHSAIKSSNILLDSNYRAKLGDFGLAEIANKSTNLDSHFTHVTRRTRYDELNSGYTAPEVGQTGRFSIKSDTFAFGVVVFEVCTGLEADTVMPEPEHRPLYRLVRFYEKSRRTMLLMDKKRSSDVPEGLVADLFETGLNCTLDNRTKRPCMVDVLSRFNLLKQTYGDELLVRERGFPVPVMDHDGQVMMTTPNSSLVDRSQSSGHPGGLQSSVGPPVRAWSYDAALIDKPSRFCLDRNLSYEPQYNPAMCPRTEYSVPPDILPTYFMENRHFKDGLMPALPHLESNFTPSFAPYEYYQGTCDSNLSVGHLQDYQKAPLYVDLPFEKMKIFEEENASVSDSINGGSDERWRQEYAGQESQFQKDERHDQNRASSDEFTTPDNTMSSSTHESCWGADINLNTVIGRELRSSSRSSTSVSTSVSGNETTTTDETEPSCCPSSQSSINDTPSVSEVSLPENSSLAPTVSDVSENSATKSQSSEHLLHVSVATLDSQTIERKRAQEMPESLLSLLKM